MINPELGSTDSQALQMFLSSSFLINSNWTGTWPVFATVNVFVTGSRNLEIKALRDSQQSRGCSLGSPYNIQVNFSIIHGNLRQKLILQAVQSFHDILIDLAILDWIYNLHLGDEECRNGFMITDLQLHVAPGKTILTLNGHDRLTSSLPILLLANMVAFPQDSVRPRRSPALLTRVPDVRTGIKFISWHKSDGAFGVTEEGLPFLALLIELINC
jgi:hypothetical protein